MLDLSRLICPAQKYIYESALNRYICHHHRLNILNNSTYKSGKKERGLESYALKILDISRKKLLSLLLAIYIVTFIFVYYTSLLPPRLTTAVYYEFNICFV